MKYPAVLLVPLALLSLLSAQTPAPTPPATVLSSGVFDWQKLAPAPTATGKRAIVFDTPTGTLDKFHGHVTTLNPGENTGALHRHPQEELVIIKEGTVEINIDGKKQITGPGSMIYFAINENENLTNVGKTPAVYYVLQWFTPLTPKN